VKSFEHKVFFAPWRREVRSYATHSTWWQDHSYFLSQKTPAPPRQLPVGYVSILFVIWAFVRVWVLLLILVPCRLQNPAIQTNGVEPWMLCDANGWLGQSFCLDSFIVFGHDTVNFGTTNALYNSIQSLATSTLTPKISNRDFSLCIWTHKHIPTEKYFTHRYSG